MSERPHYLAWIKRHPAAVCSLACVVALVVQSVWGNSSSSYWTPTSWLILAAVAFNLITAFRIISKRLRLSPRFSLRALFIAITLIACWLGYTLHVQAMRAETRRWIKEHGLTEIPYIELVDFAAGLGYELSDHRPMPLSMWLIGAERLPGVLIPIGVTLTQDEEQRIRHDFPEAVFVQQATFPVGTVE